MALRIYPSKNEPTINLSYQSAGDDVITTEGGDAKTFFESETKEFPEFWKNWNDYKIVNNSTYKMKVTLYKSSSQWDIFSIDPNSSREISIYEAANISYKISAYGGGNQFQVFTHKLNEGGCVNVNKVMRKLRKSACIGKERKSENNSDTRRTAYGKRRLHAFGNWCLLVKRPVHQWKQELSIWTDYNKCVTTLNYNPSSEGRRVA